MVHMAVLKIPSWNINILFPNRYIIHTNVMGITFLNLMLPLMFFNMILHEDGLKPTLVVCK
jgi:hypothetical protein